MNRFNPQEIKINELKRGYERRGDVYACHYCDTVRNRGEVYPEGSRLLEAGTSMEKHLLDAHNGPFRALIEAGNPISGLSEVQRTVLEGMYNREDDAEIARRLGNKARSTVRNHRYQLRERYREAKVLIALTELLDEPPETERLSDYPAHIRADDERLVVTEGERSRLLEKYLVDGRLERIPKKEKAKLVILKELADRLDPEKEYSEPEINGFLGGVSEEYISLRRYLIEYGFLDRTPDGRRYWLHRGA